MDLVIDFLQAPYVRWAAVAVAVAGVIYSARADLHLTRLWAQGTLVVSAYFAYFLVRGFTEGSSSDATANAWSVVDFERALGLFHEERMQAWIIGHQWLVDLANWIYIWGHWPVIAVVALWLLLRREREFLLFRNAFLISGAIGVVIFAAFPVAPPRLLDLDIVDTVTQHSRAYRVLQPPALVNQYAAVPSLHFGWNLLIGIALYRNTSSRGIKGLAILLPVAMGLAIVVTGNHYIVDALAGAAVALAGLALAAWWQRTSRSEGKYRTASELRPEGPPWRSTAYNGSAPRLPVRCGQFGSRRDLVEINRSDQRVRGQRLDA